MTDRDTILKWLIQLGNLCIARDGADAASERVRAYVPLLAQQFPRAAFCDASREAVARQCEFFPAYGKVCDLLSAWWRDHRPPVSAARIAYQPQPETPRAPPTTAEKAAVAAQAEAFRREMAARRPDRQPGGAVARPLPLADLLAAYRRQAADSDPLRAALARTRLRSLGEAVDA